MALDQKLSPKTTFYPEGNINVVPNFTAIRLIFVQIFSLKSTNVNIMVAPEEKSRDHQSL